MKKQYTQLTRPLLVFFVMANALLIVFRRKLESKNVDVDVVLIANVLLLGVALLNVYFQVKNLQNPNPQAVIRGVMAGTFIKLFILAAAVIIYLLAAGENRSVNAVFVSMALYIVYTWIDVKISLRLNPKK
ncbi:hypothetical protein GWC95_07355 [Sediminibacterium roseum]|uniref:ATP synthase I chain n=1 Tax=Sediminibacterium roseum TaxID=1978412 RepID=A0ABW9ZX11_9BACT|nr:hypothetical protein [Sediminibacterium roseum]NCI49733.1 hypothetical protein [Sediminibacterium roseum]